MRDDWLFEPSSNIWRAKNATGSGRLKRTFWHARNLFSTGKRIEEQFPIEFKDNYVTRGNVYWTFRKQIVKELAAH